MFASNTILKKLLIIEVAKVAVYKACLEVTEKISKTNIKQLLEEIIVLSKG
jgi:hypothetical protein